MTTDTLPDLGTAPPPRPARTKQPRRGTALVVALVLVIAGVFTWNWWSDHRADIRYGTTSVTTDEMAARYGIDINLVAVTAAGGLVEFRYQVVDPDKADRVVHDPALAPALVVEDTGEALVMNSAPHHHGAELQLGGTYFFLMANTRDAVHDGTELTVVIGDARLEHVTARG